MSFLLTHNVTRRMIRGASPPVCSAVSAASFAASTDATRTSVGLSIGATG
ncbi:MAG: hypothetical protein H6672_07015 [Anaerolineaceae bacterium]|nr:hypothetical protein [Anaerolineaceae bacterium]